MKKYIIYIISFVVVALLQISCYDDKGDYDYHEVNSMEVKIPETKLRTTALHTNNQLGSINWLTFKGSCIIC